MKKEELIQLGDETIIKDHLAEEIIFHLETVGLHPYIYHFAFTGSIYIKFSGDQEFLGSLRVADHEGRSEYRYKWNFRFDLKESRVEKDKNTLRHFYCNKDFYKMIEALRDMAGITQEPEDDFSQYYN